VDVIVPFRGSPAQLEELRGRLARLRLRPGDSMLVVDNTPHRHPPAAPEPPSHPGVPVLAAARRPTPAFARNRGAQGGNAPWLVFFDADVRPQADLLDRYFDPQPGARTGLLAGGVLDQPVAPRARPAARYAFIRGFTSQDDTLRFGDWGFPKTANCAFRRVAFEAAGGFREEIRSGEDADLSYRLRAAGWEIERREAAAVVHVNRQSMRAFVAQKLIHGAGAAWLAERYPGVFPARRRLGLTWWGVRTAAIGVVQAVLRRDRDRALWAVFEPLEQLSMEFGRSLPNHRPLFPRLAAWRAARRSL